MFMDTNRMEKQIYVILWTTIPTFQQLENSNEKDK